RSADGHAGSNMREDAMRHDDGTRSSGWACRRHAAGAKTLARCAFAAPAAWLLATASFSPATAEPNLGVSITLNSVVAASIDDSADRDTYVFDATSGTRYSISVASAGPRLARS